jgi:DNA-binding transcriptional LysR family regulator
MLPSLSSILSRLRMKHVRLLVALGDHGSLLKAAEHVGLTQPGASKALHEIESALGATLFLRTHHGLDPNVVGHCVIRYARLIQTDLAHLREEMTGILQGHGGRLTIGVIMGAVPLATEALTRLLQQRPALSVEIIEDNSARLLGLLDEGRLDLAICRTSVSQRPEQYDSTEVHQEQLAVIANRHHPLAQARKVELPDLANSQWVVYTANMPMRVLLENEFNDIGLRFPLYLIETTAAFTMLSLLKRNPTMVASVSADVARFCAEFGMVCILPLQLRARSEPYELVTRRGSMLSPVAQLFIQQLSELRTAPDAG